MEQLTDANEIWELWKEPYEWDKTTIEWLNSRPQVIKDMLLKFPSDCKVKTKKGRSLRIPGPGEIGILVSHFEDGLVSVIVPGKPIRGQCKMDWLEVVEYRPGMSVEDIEEHLEDGN